MSDPASFIVGVVTANGTAYSIGIGDASVFSQWAAINLVPDNHGSTKFNDNIKHSYFTYWNDLTNTMTTDELSEIALLDNLAKSGLTVTKGNFSTMNSWKPVLSKNKKVIKVNCN